MRALAFLLLVSLAVGGLMADEVVKELIRRAALAVLEADAFGAVRAAARSSQR